MNRVCACFLYEDLEDMQQVGRVRLGCLSNSFKPSIIIFMLGISLFLRIAIYAKYTCQIFLSQQRQITCHKKDMPLMGNTLLIPRDNFFIKIVVRFCYGLYLSLSRTMCNDCPLFQDILAYRMIKPVVLFGCSVLSDPIDCNV